MNATLIARTLTTAGAAGLILLGAASQISHTDKAAAGNDHSAGTIQLAAANGNCYPLCTYTG